MSSPIKVTLVVRFTKLFLATYAVLAPGALVAQSGNGNGSAAFLALLRELDLNG